MKKKDSIMAVFWILLGLTISIWSSRFPFGGLAHPGPAYFPLGTGLAITAFGVIMFFQARRGEKGNPSVSLETSGSSSGGCREGCPLPVRNGIVCRSF